MAAPLLVGLAARIVGKKVAKKAAKKKAHPKSKEGAELDRGIDAFRKDAKKITQQSDRRLAAAAVGGTAATVGVGAAAEKLKERQNRQRDR